MSEKTSVGITVLVGFTAYLLDDSQIVPAGIYGKSFIIQDETLIVMNELLRHLTESKVFGVKLLFYELCQGSPGINIGRISSLCMVYPDTLSQILADDVHHSQQSHLRSEDSLKQVFDGFRIEIRFSLYERVECRVDGEQQFVQFRIGLYGFIAFPVQPTLTRIP